MTFEWCDNRFKRTKSHERRFFNSRYFRNFFYKKRNKRKIIITSHTIILTIKLKLMATISVICLYRDREKDYERNENLLLLFFYKFVNENYHRGTLSLFYFISSISLVSLFLSLIYLPMARIACDNEKFWSRAARDIYLYIVARSQSSELIKSLNRRPLNWSS